MTNITYINLSSVFSRHPARCGRERGLSVNNKANPVLRPVTTLTLSVALTVPASRLQTGQVLANAQPAHRHHRPDDGRPRQPVLRPRHHHLHLRRHGHAAVRQELQPREVRGQGRSASLELQGLPALVHDRVPRAMRRVDRVDVGLHALHGPRVRALLPPHHGHRQPRRE